MSILREIVLAKSFGNGSEADIDVQPLSVTENGDYNAPSGTAYSPVTVNVPTPTPTLTPKTITENGTYAAEDDGADGYSNVTVNVQGGGDSYAIARSILDRSITEYVDDQLTRIGGSALSGASNLATLRCHAVTSIDNQGFISTKCTALAFPNLTHMGITVFRNCNKLVAFDFGPSLGSIPMQTFDGCSSLSVLVLRRATVMGMGQVSALSGTPFKSGGTGGTIYIPRSLYDHLGDGTNLDYKAATNWATYDGYGTITWAPIEGSIYETQYADGTPIPTA